MELSIERKERSAAYIQRAKCQRFVHWHKSRAISCNACFVAQCFRKGFAQAYANVLNRVVSVNIKVACALNVHVYSAVNAKGCEHMVKKAYACVYTYLALAVKLHEHLYISFLSFSFYLRCTHFHHLYRLKSYLYCICVSRQTLFFCNKNDIVLCFSESVLCVICKA